MIEDFTLAIFLTLILLFLAMIPCPKSNETNSDED